MGLKDDMERYKDIGEEKREDLEEFIKYGDLGKSREDKVKVPIKIVDLPEFEYSQKDKGGVGKGEAEEGDEVKPGEEQGEEPGEEGSEKPGYYEFDPEEFAEKLDEELGLDLEPKGKKVIKEKEGAITDLARTGTSTTLDFKRLFRKGLKRKLALEFDEDYCRELLKVRNIGPKEAFQYVDKNNINVPLDWFEQEYTSLSQSEKTEYENIEEFNKENNYTPIHNHIRNNGIDNIPYRKEDERYKYPEIEKEKQSQVVVVNIRDVSGSMRKNKRELIERVFTPLDWYLQGKYDKAEFIYIAHNVEAWEVDRKNFFGIRSGGGTKISSAYKLAKEKLENDYPWSEWNRYIFAGGDGENSGSDTKEEVIPLMKDIDTNKQAYVEAQSKKRSNRAVHGTELEEEFGDNDDYVVTRVKDNDQVTDAIEKILSRGDNNE